jgi:hypothetical protein
LNALLGKLLHISSYYSQELFGDQKFIGKNFHKKGFIFKAIQEGAKLFRFLR